MRDTDIGEFSGMLDAVCSMLSRGTYTPSGANTAMWFRSLSKHPIADVRVGFDSHVKDPMRGRFVPVPADIIAQIEGLAADDGRPGPEEAWAGALRSADEDNTVVWTAEAAQAWAIASPVLHAGDEVGARMAFKESYARLTDEARRARRAPVWTASLGHDASRRDEALMLAHSAGRLAAQDVLALPAPAEAFEALATSASAPDGIRAKLLGLRAMFARRADAPSADKIDRDRTGALKKTSADQVATYRSEA